MPTDSRRPPSRMARTIRSLGFMVLLGVSLAGLNAYTLRRDVGLATSAAGESQHAFFVNCSERPDMANFFKSLTPEVRYKMSENIGRYDDPKMAALLGTLLGDFDEEARKALTASIVKLAKTQPKAVAEQLKQKGSFQRLAVSKALSEAGVDVAPIVVDQLSVADARPNAVGFLVGMGNQAVEPLIKRLDDKDKDVRLAAADALGKLRARAAVEKLVAMLERATTDKVAKTDEYPSILAALAGIGDPKTESLLASVLTDESVPIPQRSTAALGLGRIGTPTSVATDWRYATDPDLQLRQSVISGLRVAGDLAIRVHPTLDAALVDVASGIHSTQADAVLARALKEPELRTIAIRGSTGRETLVAPLQAQLASLDVNTNGDVITTLLAALRTTKAGMVIVNDLQPRPEYLGLLAR